LSEINLKINVNTDEAEQKIRKLDADVKDVSKSSDMALNQIEQKKEISLSGIKQFAFSAFNILDSTLAIFGVTMSQGLKLVARGIFAAITPMVALFTAQELSGVMVFQAIMGMAQLAFAFAGAASLEQQGQQASNQFQLYNSMAHQILNVAGRW
jgi:hypothetical protein